MTEHKKKLPAKRVAGSLTKAINAQAMDFQLAGVLADRARMALVWRLPDNEEHSSSP
jgi:hypothetical protein